MHFFARFAILVCLLASSYLLLATSVAHAQYNNPYMTPSTDTNVPANLHTYTQSLVLEVLSALTCQITGTDPTTSSHECLGFNSATGKIGYVDMGGGAIGFAGKMIAALYTPPIDTPAYIHYVASNFGLIKHAYASTASNGSSVNDCSNNGCGFDKLTPLLGLWTTFRNISYAIFVLVFVAIGFAIMLRVKIDPRTVMTIENQIPKIIVGLILVTFSYAIAGFLIDMMYVTTYLSINVISNSSSVTTNTTLSGNIQNAEKSDLTGGNPFGFMNDIVPGGLLNIAGGSAGSVGDIIARLFYDPNVSGSKGDGGSIAGGAVGGGLLGLAGCGVLGIFTEGIGFFPCAAIVAGGAAIGATTAGLGGIDLGTVVKNTIAITIGVLASVLVFFIIAVAILVAMFRVWFSLLMAYVSILLDVVLAPFYIIAGIFPGSKVGFGMWLRDIGSNLLAFPVTVIMFLFAGVFMQLFATNSQYVFVPPLIGNPNSLPSLNGSQQSPVAYLIALGMILLTPNAVSIVREVLKAPKQTYLQTIASGLGAGVAPFSEGVKGVLNYNQLDITGNKQKWRGVLAGLLR